MAKLRKLHMWVGLILSPFLLITGLIALFYFLGEMSGSEAMEDSAKRLFDLHSWEAIGEWFGALVALALVFLAVTGIIFMLMTWSAKRKRAGGHSEPPQN